MCVFPPWCPELARLHSVPHFLLIPFSRPAVETWFSTALGIVSTFVPVFVRIFLHASNGLSGGFIHSTEHSKASSLLQSGVIPGGSNLSLCRVVARRYKLPPICPGSLFSLWVHL